MKNTLTLITLLSLAVSIASCGGNSGPGKPPDYKETPETKYYLVNVGKVVNDPTMPLNVYGFDLDGVNTATANGGATKCSAKRRDGAGGVDNQLALGLASTIESFTMKPVNTSVAETFIENPGLFLIFEVSEVNSYITDSAVKVRVARGTLKAGSTLNAENGKLTASNMLDAEVLGNMTFDGKIEGAKLKVQLGAVPFEISGISITLVNVRFEIAITANALTEGDLGGIVSKDNIIAAAAGIVPMGVDANTVLTPLLDSRVDGNGDAPDCDALSAALRLSAVALTTAPTITNP